MKYRLKLFIILAIIIQQSGNSQVYTKIPTFNFQGLEHFLHFNNDTVYIINFWASWCVPCRKELPEFEKINIHFKNRKVKVLLVSLDFTSQIDKTLIPFLEENKIESEVLLLDDPNSNAWIDKISTSWNGSIPATLIYKGNNRQFFEKELDYEFINHTVTELLNN
jgi:thiol-disulfide isomerase/thioredoxin